MCNSSMEWQQTSPTWRPWCRARAFRAPGILFETCKSDCFRKEDDSEEKRIKEEVWNLISGMQAMPHHKQRHSQVKRLVRLKKEFEETEEQEDTWYESLVQPCNHHNFIDKWTEDYHRELLPWCVCFPVSPFEVFGFRKFCWLPGAFRW